MNDETEYEQLLFDIITDDIRGGKSAVSINEKQGRLVIYANAFRAMCDGAGLEDVKFVQLGVCDGYPDRFWIRPCGETAQGARKVHKAGRTRFVSAWALITRMGPTSDATCKFDAHWDPVNRGIVVNRTRSD